jgi:long-chain acyl-CoA synthetase
MKFRVSDFLKNAAARWPERPAVMHGDQIMPFKELFEKTILLSKKLSKEFDNAGHGIALIAGNNVNFITGLFAASMSCAVVMPVWKSLTSSETESALSQSGITHILIEKDKVLEFTKQQSRISLDQNFDFIRLQDSPSKNLDKLIPGAAFIRPSSGTTGTSKGVLITHEAVLERIEAANHGLKISEEDRILWVMPMAFHFIVSICLYINYGAALLIADDFFAETLAADCEKFNATILYASPLHYRLLASSEDVKKLGRLKKAICTSAGIDQDTLIKFRERSGISITQAYGIIEAGLPIINTSEVAGKEGSVGKALPLYTVAILDEEMNVLPQGSSGLLALQGPGMFSAYLWPFQKREDVLSNSWFLTGDIATIDHDGFISILGRKKSVINITGNKVFPEEIEQVLLQHPSIREAKIFGGRHPVTGELVEAELVLMPESKLSASEIQEYCKLRLAPFKIPQRIHFVDEIIKTQTGKIIRS